MPTLPDILQTQLDRTLVRLQNQSALSHPDCQATLSHVLPVSEFIVNQCTRDTELLAWLFEEKQFHAARTLADYRASLNQSLSQASNMAEAYPRIRQWRQREMVRIAWRDLAGQSDVQQTYAELSDLAEAAIE